MSTEDEIKALEVELAEADRVRREMQQRLNDLYIRRSTEKFGIQAGMRVRNRGNEYLVESIRPDSYAASKPWLYGRKIKKDGTPGEREVTIFSWSGVRQ